MARGRKAVPTAIKEARGVDPKRRKRNEPRPKSAGATDAPDGMADAARNWWDYYAPLLAGLGVLTEVDRMALADLCRLRASLDRMYAELDAAESVMIVRSPSRGAEDGATPNLRTLPVVKDIQSQQALIMRLQEQFGLTPSSRTRVDLGEKKPEKKIDAKREDARTELGLAG
jgi:P27 family predicted phage terminase small subunit